MGYFSGLAIELAVDRPDRSYVTPERQLLWRLEDLEKRLEELQAQGAPYSNAAHYMEVDLRYGLPASFKSVWDVEEAIRLAKENLQTKYGIFREEDVEEDEIAGKQLTFSIFCPAISQSFAA